jgi:hypothetical protein
MSVTLEPITINAPITIGGVGKSAYQSYLDTTDDDPVLSEEAWAAAREGGGYVAEVEAAEAVVSVGDTDRIGWIQTVLGVPVLGEISALGLRTWLETLFAGITHKSRHATGGADALTPGDIGAATAAQGAKANTALQPLLSDVANAKAGSLGLGLAIPSVNGLGTVLQIHEITSGVAAIRLTNGATGEGPGDGFFIARWNDGQNYIGTYESEPVLFLSSGIERMKIHGSGTVEVLNRLLAASSITFGQSTIGTLPDAEDFPAARYEVPDASSPALLSPVSAGGSSRCLVYSTGTEWVVIELLPSLVS